MEFSNEVLHGLGYLANSSYISEDNYKKIINSCLGLLSGEANVERVANICPEKSDIIKQAYASLLTFTIEVIRFKVEEEIQNFLGKQNFKSDRIEYYLKVLNFNRDNILKSLENCNSGWPSIVDADWRLDYIVKSDMQNHVEGPLFFIVLTTEKNGSLDYVKFTCNLHQLLDFSAKLKEIVEFDLVIIERMTDLWNLWDVKPPPICSVKSNLHFKGISDLNEVTFNAIKTLREMNHLDREAAILSRFLYKYRRIFRHDRGIKNLVRVNQCLKRYLKLDMSSTLFTFKQCLAHNFKRTTTFAYLPTKQMLKWVLLRLQAFAQLFVRVTELAKEAGAYVYKKLCLGWSLNHSLLVFSMIARILTTSKFLVAKSIEWYGCFYKCLPHLQETADFLPEYDLPVDLKLWLGKLDVSPLKKKTLADDIFELIDLANEDEEKEEEEEDADNEVKIVKEKFIKMLFQVDVTQIDSDVEEIQAEEAKEDRKGKKRPMQIQTLDEDLGVLIDSDNEEEEDEGTSEERHNGFKKRKGGKRVKCLKKMKNISKSYEKHGMGKGPHSKGGFSQGSNILTIN